MKKRAAKKENKTGPNLESAKAAVIGRLANAKKTNKKKEKDYEF